ncbi:uncharacterized protein LOC110975010 [Acanthaster planci]|uniref:Netrin receptor UNC5 n=1 Tax=Acanthaster planci TaxID=133434 RepID=A0A8B7XRX5_ACAPL|nr:uncharacterized protein LOC110975010 [Acanthaster planci]
MIWTTAGNLFVVDESTGDNNINDQVHLPVTASPPSHKALVPQITLITVGVVTLNMLAIAGVVIMYKRSKCKKWHKRPRSGCFNNALSTPRLRATPSASQPTSVENQVDNRQNVTSDDAGVSSTSRATSGEVNTSGRYLPHSELIPQRAKESNLNVFCEPGYERGSDTSLATPQEGVATRAPVQVLQGSDPYRLVMIGQFGPEGGVLACEDSDVILEIPPGAIPADHGSQTIVAKVSLRPDIAGPKLKDSDSLWLTPLVEFESPGLERFNKDVRMRLPHCAHMKPGWTFRVNYTNPTAATNSNPGNFNQEPESDGALLPDDAKSQSQWFFVEHKCTLTKSGKSCRRVSEEGGDVTFTVDEKYFNISTSHFSKYSCSGCHKEHPLHLEAVVYWNHTKVEGREQMDLNVYILDPIKDSRAHVKENERGSECHTGYYPLILGYKKKNKETSPLEISVQEDCMGDHWKWRLDTYNGCLPAKKVFPIQSLIRCCSPLLFSRQTFSFSPKNPAEVKELTLFQAIICVKQQNWPKGEPTHILVTVPLSAKKLTGSYLNASNKEEGVVTDAHIQLVEEKLSVKKWRPLYRRLMGDGADVGIEHIAARYPDNTAEQIHEALVSWRKSLGRLATLRDLMLALEAVGQKDIAEDLRQPKEIKYELIIHDDSQSVCQETHV